MKARGDGEADLRGLPIRVGIVASRRCHTCGHHEVGIETPDGRFIPLRPGDRVGLVQPPARPAERHDDQGLETEVETGKEDPGPRAPWVPEPLRRSRSLCRIYGVLIDREPTETRMSPGLYEMAYRQKLQRLIEREADTPLSVILDRRFAAPHLASGNAKRVADALWQELDEIRAPVMRMATWLEDPDGASLSTIIHPGAMDHPESDRLTDEEVRAELDTLSIEDFLDAL